MLIASDFDKSRFFKADDFPEKEKRMKIKGVTEEFVGLDKERKLVVWFMNDERGLVLNRVNNRTLRAGWSLHFGFGLLRRSRRWATAKQGRSPRRHRKRHSRWSRFHRRLQCLRKK